MKAEDTIISWERIRMVFQELDKKGQHDPMFRMEALCETQAEISFKAGMSEVVEWIEQQGYDAPNGKLYVFIGADWQAQLKEWFKDNPELLKR